jgi:hypothetical protein
MSKPRIRLVPPSKRVVPSWLWACGTPNSSRYGLGPTPKTAYQSWRGKHYAQILQAAIHRDF